MSFVTAYRNVRLSNSIVVLYFSFVIHKQFSHWVYLEISNVHFRLGSS